MKNEEKIEQFLKLVENSSNIVFFGGAGTSTESGIPDFRGEHGLYRRKEAYPPEVILSHTFFFENPEVFYQFYRKNMIYNVSPNITHNKLAELEAKGKLKAVITQNIDGLHQKAGSKTVIELHGSISRNFCVRCHQYYGLDYIEKSVGVPRCTCGGIIKPDVVLYEEELDTAVLEEAVLFIRAADLLIVGGTSLNVYPAAGLLEEYTGAHLVLINRTPTVFDQDAYLLIREDLGVVFGKTAQI